MKTRLNHAFPIFLGLSSVLVFASACKTESGGSGISSDNGAADMQAIDKNGQAINCYAEENRFWALSKTRKTLRVGVEGEGLLKKVSEQKVTKTSASYTTQAGTLTITPNSSTWTETKGHPEAITCEFGAQATASSPVNAATIKKVQAGFDKLAEENNDDMRNPKGSKALKPSELKGEALKFYTLAAKNLKADGIEGPSLYQVKVADLNLIAILYDNQGNGTLAVFLGNGQYVTNRDFTESENLGWNTDGMGPLFNSES